MTSRAQSSIPNNTCNCGSGGETPPKPAAEDPSVKPEGAVRPNAVPKKAVFKQGNLDNREARSQQLADQRRREMATRSTLSRLRNRKSDLK